MFQNRDIIPDSVQEDKNQVIIIDKAGFNSLKIGSPMDEKN